MRQLLITGLAIAGTLIAAPTPVQARERSDADRWQRAVESCLKRHNVLSAKPGDPGCFVLRDTRIWCPSNVRKDIPAGCDAEADAAVRPQRRVAR